MLKKLLKTFLHKPRTFSYDAYAYTNKKLRSNTIIRVGEVSNWRSEGTPPYHYRFWSLWIQSLIISKYP
jgi:hypothetical protein